MRQKKKSNLHLWSVCIFLGAMRRYAYRLTHARRAIRAPSCGISAERRPRSPGDQKVNRGYGPLLCLTVIIS